MKIGIVIMVVDPARSFRGDPVVRAYLRRILLGIFRAAARACLQR